ncbi:beta-glucoside-specific PTS transporter subunit IIABC [Gracilibacillus alcaliphilus]|uniref:beta-glucoside-specific PTS transporter subunit IIABC n=1 Tax=Gracilibacillus alcaliphilus TaxID=1401441 RepID=UPI001959BC9B|nr:beta-glucoside-specific PTS transporter subunit IIABC [Gracilibacillus alcaliphilus]MBM7679793.1 PTS system beta-glucosides-specific IIC component [Gracilibacillus alcaliphilus]
MKYQEDSKQILELIGGKDNVNNLVHCATRLRFSLKDVSKANKAELEKLPFVLSVVNSGGQYQIVIGNAVSDYFAAIQSLAGLEGNRKAKEKQKFNINTVFEVISGAFSPLIPVMAGAGMVKALLTVLSQLGWISEASSTYAVLSAASNSIFYFLPIFLGITLANKLGGNLYVGGAIGAALMEPSFTALIGETSADFIRIPLEAVDYATTIFPIFIAIFIYQFLDKLLKKIIYKDIQLFAVPMISLLVMVPLTVMIFGPFGTIVGDGLSTAVMWLYEQSSLLSGVVLGGGMTFMVMFGLHWGFTPITLENLNSMGGDPVEGMALAAVFAQIGIAIGFYLRAKKHSKMRSLAGSTAITGLLAGVTEPIVYGIVLRYKRLIPIVAISGAIGGAILGGFGVTMNAYVFHNLFSIPVYTPHIGYFVGIAASLIAGGVLAYFFGVKEETPDFAANVPTPATEGKQDDKLFVYTPAKGNVITLSEVEDDVFSSGIAGKGVAVIPTEGEIVAPFDATIVAVFPSKHAIGLKAENGTELLIHVGLDTVNLNGKYFEAAVANGDNVKRGDLLLTFDHDKILAEGYKLTTPVIVTNPDQMNELENMKEDGAITLDSVLFEIGK